MKYEAVLLKTTAKKLRNANYDGAVFVPVVGECSDIPFGESAVSFSNAKRAIRTIKQNSSMHKYFSLLSDKLNSKGLDMKLVLEKLSKNTMIPWSPSAVKERLWRVVQEDTYGKDKTSRLDTKEVSIVYENLNLVTSQRLGVGVPFPDAYNQSYESLMKK